ncbi:Dps family protein [Jannaschia sp. W003]|uniref:Dps family protein n=1 Tax=Jannaschia sp. W003 TaxID=2867012 RepID=UPI0021A51B9B|nr:DNA starvation/stationary phase protection protein [Jannaschia sp. W003]UWQ22700.1 DNA starvation/stationary phase protection protein [Jannaschia sp. W003]
MRLAAPLVALAVALPVPAIAQGTDPLPLAQEVRDPSAEALQATLYDLIALRHAAHQAHWNVVGIEFYQLHEFFAELYDGLAPMIDQVAERKRALGAPADGRPSAVAENAAVDGAEPAEIGGEEAVQRLLEAWSTVSPLMYDRLEAVSDDTPTQDLLIAVTALLDKQMWQLRAHAQ